MYWSKLNDGRYTLHHWPSLIVSEPTVFNSRVWPSSRLILAHSILAKLTASSYVSTGTSSVLVTVVVSVVVVVVSDVSVLDVSVSVVSTVVEVSVDDVSTVFSCSSVTITFLTASNSKGFSPNLAIKDSSR